MRPVLFDDAERQHARVLRLLDRPRKICRGQLFPLHRQLLTVSSYGRERAQGGQHERSGTTKTKYLHNVRQFTTDVRAYAAFSVSDIASKTRSQFRAIRKN